MWININLDAIQLFDAQLDLVGSGAHANINMISVDPTGITDDPQPNNTRGLTFTNEDFDYVFLFEHIKRL